ncbi:Imm32 family immunity protein [Kitasatospora sp. NPDC004272]
MEIDGGTGDGEVVLAGSAEELRRLAELAAAGAGLLPAHGSLRGIEVRASAGGVLAAVDEERSLLVIGGGEAARTMFAADLREIAGMDDGGHFHIEHVVEPSYPAEGSLPLVVYSPHGGMPRR